MNATIRFEGGGAYQLTRQGDDDTGDAGDLDIAADVTITGQGAARPVIIEQRAPNRVFDVYPGGRLAVEGLTIRGGAATQGAGIYVNYDRSVFLTGVTLTANSASQRGGAIFTNGIVRLTSTTVSGNSGAIKGGGIHVGISGDLATLNVTIAASRAQRGGGIFVAGDNGLVVFTNSTPPARRAATTATPGQWNSTGSIVRIHP